MLLKKATNIPEEVEEIRKSLDVMSAEISTIVAQQKRIMESMREVQSLRKQNMEKDKRITSLENRVADLKQYSQMNDIIISGLQTRHRTYARATVATDDTTVGHGANASEAERESLEQQVVGFLVSKSISIDSGDIEAYHTLPSKNKSAIPAKIICFTNRKKKNELLRQGRKLKGSDVYVNQHLTKKNADIARRAY